ncbi:hypothetical protein CRG98_023654 [Punica granatum]|uniref:Uncharacterized protein n=1 Tax=Punica granatum TaxID=22663 RepID=A0A2I0JI45_PUNGR|nr:hypothetical protein CRG98_023654 [Punica granatum]
MASRAPGRRQLRLQLLGLSYILIGQRIEAQLLWEALQGLELGSRAMLRSRGPDPGLPCLRSSSPAFACKARDLTGRATAVLWPPRPRAPASRLPSSTVKFRPRSLRTSPRAPASSSSSLLRTCLELLQPAALLPSALAVLSRRCCSLLRASSDLLLLSSPDLSPAELPWLAQALCLPSPELSLFDLQLPFFRALVIAAQAKVARRRFRFFVFRNQNDIVLVMTWHNFDAISANSASTSDFRSRT